MDFFEDVMDLYCFFVRSHVGVEVPEASQIHSFVPFVPNFLCDVYGLIVMLYCFVIVAEVGKQLGGLFGTTQTQSILPEQEEVSCLSDVYLAEQGLAVYIDLSELESIDVF